MPDSLTTGGRLSKLGGCVSYAPAMRQARRPKRSRPRTPAVGHRAPALPAESMGKHTTNVGAKDPGQKTNGIAPGPSVTVSGHMGSEAPLTILMGLVGFPTLAR